MYISDLMGHFAMQTPHEQLVESVVVESVLHIGCLHNLLHSNGYKLQERFIKDL